MTKEERELLLKDLCTRLPYGVICFAPDDEYGDIGKLWCIEPFEDSDPQITIQYPKGNTITKFCSEVKPYLRPMSSMTEEEYDEFKDLTTCGRWCDDYDRWAHWGVEVVAYEYDETDKPYYNFVDFQKLLDWLNSHHFDYRGLIEKGLAFPAMKGIY